MQYKGYTIEIDHRNPYGSAEYMFYRTFEGVNHDADYDGEGYKYCGNCRWASSEEEAKIEIDFEIEEKGTPTQLELLNDETFWLRRLNDLESYIFDIIDSNRSFIRISDLAESAANMKRVCRARGMAAQSLVTL